MSTSHLTRRLALVAGTTLAAASAAHVAAIATVVKAAEPDADAELLQLGIELEKYEQQWLVQVIDDKRRHIAHDIACTKAGLPYIPRPDDEDRNDKSVRARTAQWHDYMDKRHAIPEEEPSFEWDDFAPWHVIDEIFSYVPTTIAGFGVQARAIVLHRAHEWANEWYWDWAPGRGSYSKSDENVRILVEGICALCGITTILQRLPRTATEAA